jgi:hypothetical protein
VAVLQIDPLSTLLAIREHHEHIPPVLYRLEFVEYADYVGPSGAFEMHHL